MKPAAAALWGVFAAALIFGAGRFLFACGAALGPIALNYCAARPDLSAWAREAERGERLRRSTHAAEMRLAQLPPCGKSTLDEGLRKKIDEAYDQGARRGMLEVFLTWGSLDDLDLVVFCPGSGSIGGAINRQGSCGDGAIDKDANGDLKDNISASPSEHAVWDRDIPTGAFIIGAYLYKAVDPAVAKSIPFTMAFKLGAEERACSGVVRYHPKSSGKKTRGGKVMLARDLYIVWSSGSPLPNCDWREYEAADCGEKACQSR